MYYSHVFVVCLKRKCCHSAALDALNANKNAPGTQIKQDPSCGWPHKEAQRVSNGVIGMSQQPAATQFVIQDETWERFRGIGAGGG